MKYLKIKKNVYIPWDAKDVDPFLIPDNTIRFYINLIFYNEFPDEKRWSWPNGCDSKIILDFKLFKFDDLTTGKIILTKIKTRINKELKKNSSDLTFFY